MAEEKISLKKDDIDKMISQVSVECLEKVSIEGDVEIELSLGDAGEALLFQSLGCELANLAMHLVQFSKSMGYPEENLAMLQKA
jgi:CO dehydrogenase/acetyl-CoA synthase delta subunit